MGQLDIYGNTKIVNENDEKKLIYSVEEIVEQAIHDFRVNGFIFKDLKLFECMQELNVLRLKRGNDLLFCYDGYSVADTYHKHRYFGNAIGMKSPYDSFHVEKNIRKVIKQELKISKKITHRLYSFFNIVNGTQANSNFRPAFAKYLYDLYCIEGDKVLDCSTGYGGRLIGFICSNASEYIGFDPSLQTHRANKKIAIDLGSKKKIKLHNVAVELFKDERYIDYFDFSFTSPPYFHKEIYSNDDFQSSNQYQTYENWRECFLKKMIEFNFKSLKKGGVFVLNIENVKIKGKNYNLVNDAISFAKGAEFKFTEELKFPLKNSGDTSGSKYERCLIFTKH